MEEENGWKGENRRISRNGLDQLELEIHQDKVRVWVDGASTFLADPKSREALETVIQKILDSWLKARAKTALAAFGLTALAAMLLTLIGYMGWTGWGGKK